MGVLQVDLGVDLLGNMCFTDNRAQHSFIHQQILTENLLWFRYCSKCPVELFIRAEDRAQIINITNNKLNGIGKRNRGSCHINIITVEVVS